MCVCVCVYSGGYLEGTLPLQPEATDSFIATPVLPLVRMGPYAHTMHKDPETGKARALSMIQTPCRIMRRVSLSICMSEQRQRCDLLRLQACRRGLSQG